MQTHHVPYLITDHDNKRGKRESAKSSDVQAIYAPHNVKHLTEAVPQPARGKSTNQIVKPFVIICQLMSESTLILVSPVMSCSPPDLKENFSLFLAAAGQ